MPKYLDLYIGLFFVIHFVAYLLRNFIGVDEEVRKYVVKISSRIGLLSFVVISLLLFNKYYLLGIALAVPLAIIIGSIIQISMCLYFFWIKPKA